MEARPVTQGYGLEAGPVEDDNGRRLLPDALLEDAPPLDVLHVPGGLCQEILMEDARVLGWLRRQAEGAACVFSIYTGALLLGATGLLKGRRATAYWAIHHLLAFYGAEALDAREVKDGRIAERDPERGRLLRARQHQATRRCDGQGRQERRR